MKVAFFASDKIAIESIKQVMNSPLCELVCIVSNPDKQKGRGKQLSPNDVSSFALENDIKLFRPNKNEEELLLSQFDELQVDFILVMAYGSILKDCIINYPKLLCLNLHGSILPELRGASPIESAIAMGFKETGVSLMKIEKKMDAGDVADVAKIDILESDTSKILREKVGILASELLRNNLDKISKGALQFCPQDNSKATYARKLDKFDMRLDFTLGAKELSDRIRAFGAGIFAYEDIDIKIFSTKYEECEHNRALGEIVLDKDILKIATKNSYLIPQEVQKPCAKLMNISDFMKAFNFENGKVLNSFKNKILIEKK